MLDKWQNKIMNFYLKLSLVSLSICKCITEEYYRERQTPGQMPRKRSIYWWIPICPFFAIFFGILSKILEIVRRMCQPCRKSKCIAGHQQDERWEWRLFLAVWPKLASPVPQAWETLSTVRWSWDISKAIAPPTRLPVRQYSLPAHSCGHVQTEFCHEITKYARELVTSNERKLWWSSLPAKNADTVSDTVWPAVKRGLGGILDCQHTHLLQVQNFLFTCPMWAK